ncbi:MAG TPA: thiol:disulfide interchange protein DsbA/DsbL [Steroidobacteraceae bacterium]
MGIRSLPLTLLLLVTVAACARDNTPARAPQAGTVAAPAPAATTPAATTVSSESVAAAAAPEGAQGSLERFAALPPEQQLPGGHWVAGRNYDPLVPAQPTDVAAGKVEVVEVFWYACGHCYALDPFLESWRKNKAAYIEFVRVPVMWGPVQKAHARLFYTLQVLGVEDRLHSKVFDEIHQRGNNLVGADDAQTLQVQLAFAKSNGITEADFMKAYNSFTVNSDLQRAEQLTARYHVSGVPLMVIAGKYTTDVGKAGSADELIKLVDDLAASEKRH